MIRAVLTLLFVFCASPVFAHTPVIVDQSSLTDIEIINDPTLSHVLYGWLSGFPHTFEIKTETALTLAVEILVPDILEAVNNVNVIIIKELPDNGGVTEVARILAKDATWETFWEPFGADSFRQGGTFSAEVDPGVYRIEVSTPDNREPYALVIGSREEFGVLGYFKMLGRILAIKELYGKSQLSIIASPLVYVPAIILGLIGLLWWYRRARIRIPTTLPVV